MTYYNLTARNNSSYTLPYLNTGVLLTESGDVITTESGDGILIDNPTNNPNLTARSSSSYTLPNRN